MRDIEAARYQVKDAIETLFEESEEDLDQELYTADELIQALREVDLPQAWSEWEAKAEAWAEGARGALTALAIYAARRSVVAITDRGSDDWEFVSVAAQDYMDEHYPEETDR